jgi:hypothetical protein
VTLFSGRMGAGADACALVFGSVIERAITEVTTAMAAPNPSAAILPKRYHGSCEWPGANSVASRRSSGINTRRPQAELRRLHRPVIDLLQPLIERGQHAGACRSDVPAQRHLSMLLALINAASSELQAKRIPARRSNPRSCRLRSARRVRPPTTRQRGCLSRVSHSQTPEPARPRIAAPAMRTLTWNTRPNGGEGG